MSGDPFLHQVFPGESEMARMMRAYDWDKTNVGSPQRWPDSLRTVVSVCVSSRFPMVIWWDREEYAMSA